MKNKKIRNIIFLVISLITLPLIIFIAQQVSRLLSRATYQPANLVIDTQSNLGPLQRTWAGFAQGGEEPPPMLTSTVSKMHTLNPRYIRLDHIYDSYDVAKRQDDKFVYDFSRLDKTVDDIVSMGAMPFFSLSYMPSVFTASGNLIDTPRDWNWWKDLVRATIEHYSGKTNKNFSDIYYEVWNEPELPQFGSWKISAEKDYRILYFNSEKGAREAQNTNNFYLGGPGLGSYYPNWINGLLTYVSQNNLKFDFYSWHRYHKRPAEYVSDAVNTRKLISNYSKYAKIPLFLTEWGIESENTAINNTNIAAAYTVYSINNFHSLIDLAFVFEVKDGPPPSGGKWGLLTHEKDKEPLRPKPRFKAFSALNNLNGNELSVTGDGTFVNAMATKSDQTIKVVISNYDLSGKNSENVPVSFTGLAPSSYKLKFYYPLDNTGSEEVLNTTTGILSKSFPMTPNTILILELTGTGKVKTAVPTPSFTIGKSGQTQDQALLLSTPLTFSPPQFTLSSSGTISFDIKSSWPPKDDKSFTILEIPYQDTGGNSSKITLLKQKSPGGSILVFGSAKGEKKMQIAISINDWQKDTWHDIFLGWDESGLFISVDGKPAQNLPANLDIQTGNILTFYPIEAALDNLNITLNGQPVIQRGFDGNITQ